MVEMWGESLRVREKMMMSHPAPQRDCPSTAALEDHKKGDFFPGAENSLSLGGSGPIKNGRVHHCEWECSSLAQSTLQVVPCPTHHSPENW